MNIKLKKRLFWSLGIIVSLLIFLLATFFVIENKYSNKIYKNVYVSGINMAGLTPSEAENLLQNKIAKFDQAGFKIILKDREISWYNLNSSFDPDLASQVIIFDTEKTIFDAYNIGRQGNIYDYFVKLKLLFSKSEVALNFSINKEELAKTIEDNFSDLENPAKNASLVFKKELLIESKVNVMFYIEPENFGQKIDYDKFVKEFENNAKLLASNDINLVIIDDSPSVRMEDAKGLEFEADNLLDLAPVTLVYEDGKKEFEINSIDFASWLYLEPQVYDNNKVEVKVSVDQSKVEQFFEEKIKTTINQEPVLPKFDFKNNKVVSFEAGHDGLKLNYQESYSNIKKAFEDRNMKKIPLVVEVDPVQKVEDFNDLGISEIIGTGHSNFVGSTANRRHNIKTGASKLHGLIIKPGEEFSLVTALGEVDGSTGYLQELVIKGNKTTPEYGGGLCQIATTMFRTALASGLPIIERRNHSYRVSYYEPAGTDATIYTPRPDLKFKNDTGNNILIQARFEGTNDIYFDFWGKSDGRTATTTYPTIYNIVKPGPTQIIETTELKPGEKKCTERAHSGADAYFDYSVVYNSGLENEKKVDTRFTSKYVPWREVCLVGVEPKEEPATSTENIIENNTSTPVVTE